MLSRTAKDALAIPWLAVNLPETQVQTQQTPVLSPSLSLLPFPALILLFTRYPVLQQTETDRCPYTDISTPFQSPGEIVTNSDAFFSYRALGSKMPDFNVNQH